MLVPTILVTGLGLSGVLGVTAAVPAGATPSMALKVVAGLTGPNVPYLGTPVPGTAVHSPLELPSALAVDSSGDLFIADSGANEILKVTADGTLSVIAGTGQSGPPTPGPATSSTLNSPSGVAVDAAGDVFIADSGNAVIEEVTPNGNLSIVAGNGQVAGIGQVGAPTPGPALSTPLGYPRGLAVDSSGNLYIADQSMNLIEKVTPNGMLSVVAGVLPVTTLLPNEVFNPNAPRALPLMGPSIPGPATSSPLNNPFAVAVDQSGNLYIADAINYEVEKVTPDGTLSIIAGNGTYGPPVAGPATSSPMRPPTALAVDPSGDVDIAMGGRLLSVTPSGILSTIAGSGTAWPKNGTSITGVKFLGMTGVAVDANGNVYFADGQSAIVGEIVPSSQSGTTTGATAPSAPTNVVASAPTGGGAAASISFTPPSSNGGSPITSYTVHASDLTAPQNGGQQASGSGSPIVVPGLTEGDTYVFTVVATNGVGTSGSSAQSASFTPLGLPGAPTDVQAVANQSWMPDGSASVSFTPSPTTGGSTVSSFSVTANDLSNPASPTNGSGCLAGPGISSNWDACLVTGLTDGDTYAFTVTANSVVGSSVASPASVPVTPAGAPGAPHDVSAMARDGAALVSFTAPTTSGGSPVTGYTVTAQNLTTPGAGGDGATCSVDGAAPALQCTVDGLINGDQYVFTVTATNAVATSPASIASALVTPEPFAADVAVKAGNRSLSVSWSPSSAGSIDSYVVFTTAGDGTSCTTTSTACTLRWLTNGTPETVEIDAYDQDGNLLSTVVSDPVAPMGAPLAPINVNAVSGDHSAIVSWQAANDQGSPVTSYTVSDGAGATCTTATTTCTVSGLTPGAFETFTVTATNGVGVSPASVASNAVQISAAPSVPTDVSVVPGFGSLVVSWSASSSNGGSAVTSYVVTDGAGDSCVTDQTSCALTGLSRGETYSVTVLAENGDGLSSAASDAVSGTPGDVADAPSNVSALPTRDGVIVSWQASGFTGGVPITSYTVVSSDGQTCTTTETSCAITGLTAGVAQRFTVHANNAFGSSSNAPWVSAVPFDVPAQVTGVVASPQPDGSILVQWNPTNGSGLPIAGYMVRGVQGGQCVSQGFSCVITNLPLGSDYQFTVIAVNDAGPSMPSRPSSPVLAAALPGTPTNVTVVGGDRSALLSWSPGSENGSPVISYAVYAGSVEVCQTAQTTCAIGGLVNGQTYTFAVLATNGMGQGGAAFAPAVVPAGAPNPPTGLRTTVGDGTVTISWTASSTNGTPVTSYTVNADNGSSCSTADGATTSCTITGLTDGQATTFYVVANSLAGSSLASTISATPIAVPSAPTNVSVVARNGTAVVSFQPPTFNGGSTILEYVVSATDLSAGGVVQGGCTTTAAGSCRVSGLINGDGYRFSVVAVNAAGASPSGISPEVIPAGPPSAPTGVTAVATSGRATVSWNPAAANGSPVTSYTVTNGAGLTCSSSSTSCTVHGLTNGNVYVFTVWATNALGTSAASSPSAPVTPATKPGAPRNVVATFGNGSGTISWTAPTSSGGAPVSSYTASDGSDSCVTSATSCTVVGLTNGATYTFTVTATNVAGVSSPSNPVQVTPATAAAAPTVTGVTSVTTGLEVTFQAPQFTGGSPVSSYLVSTDGGTTFVPAGKGDLFGSVLLVTGLSPGSTYKVALEAVNGAGTSAASNVVVATFVTTASAPTITSVSAQQTTMTVAYQAPTTTGGSAIAAYQYSLDGGSTWKLAPYGTSGTLRITGLSRHTTYRVELRAVNSAGIGEHSNVKVVRTN
jgi:titin